MKTFDQRIKKKSCRTCVYIIASAGYSLTVRNAFKNSEGLFQQWMYGGAGRHFLYLWIGGGVNV